ncbi:MAG: branched-chain amino acid ABC transporter permease [Pseudomonadota bacterium]
MDLFPLWFFLESTINGALIGLMYALVALGFVLIYKSTDAINFAQGQFVMVAGIMVAAMFDDYGIHVLAGFLIALVFMIFFNVALERVVLRPMIGRDVVAIIMATIGLASFLEGLFPMIFGSSTRSLELGIPNDPWIIGEVYLTPINVIGGAVAILFFAVFSWFFVKSRKGVALRAVADNHQVSMAMGINVERYFVLAWSMAGVVAVLGGLLWGSAIGVDNTLAVVGLKVFPVVILGGLESIKGCVVGGIIVGVVEAWGGTYIDPAMTQEWFREFFPFEGGGTKDFLPYLLMIVVLFFRPYGLYGKVVIERV